MPDIKAIYEQQFLPAREADWMATYVAAADRVRAASEAEFRSAAFQKSLWEIEGVSSIGPGASVTVPGAYSDAEVIQALWDLREWEGPADARQRAQHLDAEFHRILGLVSPKHNKRRPSARLVRIFTALRPYDVVCLMDWRRTVQFRQWADRPSFGLGLIGQNVVARQAVRDAIGAEADLTDAVSIDQFAWFVWELIDAAENEGAERSMTATMQGATDAPNLALLPAKMQRKGMFYVANNLALILSVVRAAENGIEKDDLVNQVGEEAPNLKVTSRQNVLSQAVSLNLLSVDRGVYRPTGAGRALLEGGSPADMLTPTFVRTVFGFALILDDLRVSPGLERGQIADRCREYYPNWTSDFAPNSLVAWMRDMGLVTVVGNGRAAAITLTEAGEYWASGLPDNMRSPEHLLNAVAPENVVEDQEEPEVTGAVSIANVAIADILDRFEGDVELQRFVFDKRQIQLVHAALHGVDGKRFILLAGLSGTGKTSMAQAYARAYCDVLEIPFKQHYCQVSVWPDWTDPSGLLGYVNPLADPPTFHETATLKLLLSAVRNPTKPYFLCLDEMNLARVEHYFAPFLTAMEGRNGRLAIHAGDGAVDQVPPTVPWPTNLFIVGTVNMDETTHPFSDKVLDRAFTFEFWEADLPAWKTRASSRAQTEVLDRVFDVLQRLYEALKPARRHFGYRTCDEVLGFCAVSSDLPLDTALDAAVLAKVLPKVRGEGGGALNLALSAAIQICVSENLPQSKAKLQQMEEALQAQGLVRFWS